MTKRMRLLNNFVKCFSVESQVARIRVAVIKWPILSEDNSGSRVEAPEIRLFDTLKN